MAGKETVKIRSRISVISIGEQRKLNPECGAAAGGAFDGNSAVVVFDNLFHNSQPQAAAAAFARTRFIHPEKPVENLVANRLSQSRSRYRQLE